MGIRRFELSGLQTARQYIVLLIIVLVAISVRLVDLSQKALWYDELQSVTQSSLPLRDLLKSVRAFDPHPPLYYLQLHFWLKLGQNDEWIKLNSVFWSVLTVIFVYLLSKELFDHKTAFLAALIFALSPLAVFYAQEARMYAFLMFLAVASFYLLCLYLKKQALLYLIGSALLTEAFLYSHGAGFMILVCISAYLVLFFLRTGFMTRKLAVSIGLTLALIIILYVPELLAASSISVGHTEVPDLMETIRTLFMLLGGLYNFPDGFQIGVVILVCIGSFMAALKNVQARDVFLAFIFAPVAFCFVVSHLYRPIWLYRTLAFIVPFWCIILAFVLSQVEQRIGMSRRLHWAHSGFTAAFFIGLCILLGFQQLNFRYDWRIRDAAGFLQAQAKPGDAIYVANVRVYWGLGWYFIGPGSVNPLSVAQPLVSPSNVSLISGPDGSFHPKAVHAWLVYRSIDDISAFASWKTGPSWDFGNMKVVQMLDR